MVLAGMGMATVKYVNNGLLRAQEVELVARRLYNLSLHSVKSLTALGLKECLLRESPTSKALMTSDDGDVECRMAAC